MADLSDILNDVEAALTLRDFYRARQLCSDALSIDPSNSAARANLGVAQVETGSVDDGIMSLRMALPTHPRPGDVYNALGMAYVKLDDLVEARECLLLAIEHDPENATACSNLGNVLRQLGQDDDAERCYREAVKLRSDFALAWKNLGDLLASQNRSFAAMSAYEKALEIRPQFVGALNNLGRLCEQIQQTERAKKLYARAIEADSEYVPALVNLGTLRLADDDLSGAMELLRTAVQLADDSADAHCNLASAEIRIGRLDAALRHCRCALELDPEMAEAHWVLGRILALGKHTVDAIGAFQRAAEIRPELAPVHFSLANILHGCGRFDEALESLNKAITLRPEQQFWQFFRETLCPSVFNNVAGIDHYHQRLTRILDRYMALGTTFDIRDIEDSNFTLPFALVHHGRNMRSTKEKLAAVFEPFVSQFGPHVGIPNAAPKVGFFITPGNEGVYVRMLGELIRRLDLNRLTVYLVGLEDSVGKFVTRAKCEHLRRHVIGLDLSRAIESIRALNLDVLFYRHIGTGYLTYFLPLVRLARVQCASVGVHQTSGIPNIDFFLSSKLLEPNDGAEHYSEELALMETLPTFQLRRSPPDRLKTRSDVGLPANKRLYVCPQRPMKIHPDQDHLFARILQNDPDAVVVLVGDRPADVRLRQVRDRFCSEFPEISHRVVLLPFMKSDDYLSLIHHADVVLDTVHYSASSSAYDAFSLNRPIVTLPGDLSMGRYTLGCYKKMQIDDLVATTAEEYVELAIQVASNVEYRDTISHSLFNRSGVLFKDEQAVRDIETFVTHACKHTSSA